MTWRKERKGYRGRAWKAPGRSPMARTLIATAIVAGLIGAVLLAPTAAASHWCDQTTFALAPASATDGRATTFTVTITNTGVDNTQLDRVDMKFSWEGTWRNASSGILVAGTSKAFSLAATPPSAGTYSVEVNATGTSSGDLLREITECRATSSITVTAPFLPGFEAALATLALAGAAIAAAARWKRV